MTTVTCDICGARCDVPFIVELDDGEHPHCGSPMTKKVDCCVSCLKRLPLRAHVELSDVQLKCESEKRKKSETDNEYH